MAENRRKSTVREALSKNLKAQKRKIVGKLRGRYLFRAAVRLVIEYIEWIGSDVETEEIGDNVSANVKIAKRKKSSAEQDFTIKDRSILLISPSKRTMDDIAYITYLIRDIKAFTKYPDDIRDSLADSCTYQYVPAGRTIIRQGKEAEALYYIVNGQLKILRNIVTDTFTGNEELVDVGVLNSGDMFGQIALLHQVPRTATVVSKTATDLLIIEKGAFNKHLRCLLLEEWDVLRDALINFNYFKGWNEETMRECCILSKILNFKPNEILLGDGKGMVHFVYFLLSGECRLIEHMLVEKNKVGKKVQYKLYDSQQKDKNPRQRIGRSKKLNLTDDDLATLLEQTSQDGITYDTTLQEQRSAAEEYIKLLATKKSKSNIVMDRISVITVTLQDVLNQWHEITDAVEMLRRQPSTASLRNYPQNVQTVFMQICTYYRGACFGLGEHMENRRIVSITPAKCLLIPRFWLTEKNRANIWQRVKHFMNSKFPDNNQLLHKYIENRTWAAYKREYSKEVVKKGRKYPNDTKNYDVPYSIRINETIIDE